MKHANHSRRKTSLDCDIGGDHRRYSAMPIGLRLEQPSQIDQTSFVVRPGDDLQSDGQSAAIEADWKRERRQTEIVDEAREAAESVKRARTELGRCRVRLGRARRLDRNDRQ